MTREEAIRIIRETYHTDEEMKALESLIPELRKSEDERIRHALIEFLREAYSRGNAPEECAKWIVWLDQPKEQKPAVSEHDAYELLSKNGYVVIEREVYNELCEKAEQKPDNKCKGCNNVKGCINCVDGSEWAHIEEIEQKPAEWSEEDERIRLACIATINDVIDYERDRWEDYNPGKPYRPITKYDEQIDWLKSLRHQPSWKPSEEQMNALQKFFIEGVKALTQTDCNAINSIYLELKTLI